jgi:solute carrier family 50 protein (sugar transporter)
MAFPPVVANLIFPILGVIVCDLLWLTPLPVILEARYTRYMGALNPYPLVVTCISNIGWTIYACLKKDIYIFAASVPAVILGFYYTIVCLTVIAKKDANSDFSAYYIEVETFLLLGILFWCIIGFVVAMAFHDPTEGGTAMVGYIVCALSIAYYASPLSSLYKIIREWDSSSLYLPLLIMNFINAGLWFVYGYFGVQDANLWMQSAVGLGLSTVQILIRCVVPVREKAQVQTFAHVFHLMTGQIPPTFETDHEVLRTRANTAIMVESGKSSSSSSNNHGSIKISMQEAMEEPDPTEIDCSPV